MKKINLYVFLFALMTPSLAFAAEQQAVWQIVLQHLLEIIVAIAVPVLSTLAYSLLKKYGIKVQLETLNSVLDKAIGFAEQKASNALKKGGDKTDGGEKLNWALEKGKELATANKLDKWVIDKLEDLIEAKLGEKK